MNRIAICTTLTTFLTVAIAGAAIAADGGPRCGTQTLKGRYVFSASGFMTIAGVTVPKAIVEVLEFNGDHALAATGGTRSVNGDITPISASAGTYTLKEDCTGTITFGTVMFDIFVSPRGNQFWLIQTNPATVFQGSATRTSHDLGDSDR